MADRIMLIVGFSKRRILNNMSEWILCEDRFPNETDDVLVNDIHKNLWVGCYHSGGYWEDNYGNLTDNHDVIAWMPLPEPYKR